MKIEIISLALAMIPLSISLHAIIISLFKPEWFGKIGLFWTFVQAIFIGLILTIILLFFVYGQQNKKEVKQ